MGIPGMATTKFSILSFRQKLGGQLPTRFLRPWWVSHSNFSREKKCFITFYHFGLDLRFLSAILLHMIDA